MRFKQWIKVIVVTSIGVTLAACSTHKKNYDDTVAVNDANAAYGAQSSGVGDESSFGDQAGGSPGSLAAKRVYYFDFDSNVVREDDKPAIVANANHLIKNDRVKTMLEGHTDPRGSREYNIGLGERRAKSVAEVLAAKGVNPSQIRVVSYGAEKLASPGHSEDAYQKDRRVVLVYSK